MIFSKRKSSVEAPAPDQREKPRQGRGVLAAFKNLKMRNKMLVVAIPPLIVVVVLSVIGIVDRRAEANEATEIVSVIDFSRSNAALASALRNESIYSLAYITAPNDETRTSAREKLDQARTATDTTVENYRLSLAENAPEQGVPSIASTVTGLNDRLADLPTTRLGVDDSQIPISQIKDYYAQSSRSSDRIALLIAQSVDNPELVGGFNTAANLSAWQTAISTEAAGLVAVEQKGSFFDGNDARCESVLLASCVSYVDSQRFLAQSIAAEELLELNSSFQDNIAKRDAVAQETYTERATAVRAQGVEGNAVSLPGEEQEFISVSSVSLLNDIAQFEQDIIAETRASAVGISDDAQRAVLLFAFTALLAVVVASAAALYAARLTTDPLVRLTQAAKNLSEERIPNLVRTLRDPQSSRSEAEQSTDALMRVEQSIEDISVDSSDEIGELAQAFSSIQEVTVEVAEQQSELLQKGIGDIFVNLARRNQVLLDRQIKFIEKMEEGEESPEQLANLFKLDHLATRMRRNAESLLVLAGAEQGRGKRGQSVSISDVIRVGMGEVEDFQRVQITHMDPVNIPGNIASDLAHMLGELIENATQFSPPDTFVEVDGNLESSGVYYMRVVDRGIGMTNEAIAAANHLLANPPFMGLEISRSLGFIVVGRLASRFNIKVTLAPNPGGGIIATVAVPPATIYEGPSQPQAPQQQRPSGPPGFQPDMAGGAGVGGPAGRSGTMPPPSGAPQVVFPPPPVERPAGPERPHFPAPQQPVTPAAAHPTPPPRPAPPIPPQQPPQQPAQQPAPPASPPVMPPVTPQGPPARPFTPPPLPQPTDAPPVVVSSDGAPALPKRRPGATEENKGEIMDLSQRHAASAQRTPEQVRQMLSRYRSGMSQGRVAPPGQPPAPGQSPGQLPGQGVPPPPSDSDSFPLPPPGAALSELQENAVPPPPAPSGDGGPLTRRVPNASSAPGGERFSTGISGVSRSARSPEEVKDVLLRYRSGLKKAQNPT